MATPGYPQMMGAPGMQMPMRRGAPKIVPVIVGAGLAVGVFCGLLFGVGTKDKTKTDDKPVKVTATEAAPEGLGASTAVPPPKPAMPTMPAVAAGSGSAAPAATGSAAPAHVEPTVKTAKLVIDIKPDEAAKDAKIQVNGNDITGNTVDLPVEQKSVKLSIKTTGYHSVDKTMSFDMKPGDETKVEIEMQKRGGGAAPAAGSPGFGGASHTAPTVPKAPPGPPKPPKPKGGGVIDI